MELRITVGGRFQGKGLGRLLDDLDVPVRTWAELQVGRLIKAFGKGGHGDRGGEQWIPLSPRTIRAKQRRIFKGLKGKKKLIPISEIKTTMLVVTGHMRGSIHQETTMSTVTGPSVAIGTNVSYAKYHQYGTPRIPARPIVVVTSEDRKDLVNRITKYLKKKTNGKL